MSTLPLYFDLYLIYFFIGFVVVSNVYVIAQLPLSFKNSTSLYQALQQKLSAYIQDRSVHFENYSFLK